jgi:hypothetical protein
VYIDEARIEVVMNVLRGMYWLGIISMDEVWEVWNELG